jgi:trimeric autotransporter adhesin
MEIERLNDELAKSLPMVNDVADAFGDFLARGMTDFKSFANSIFKSFQNMLAQMIATAARNKILISMGATGSVAGTAASAGVGSAIGTGVGAGIGGIAAFGSGIGTWSECCR